MECHNFLNIFFEIYVTHTNVGYFLCNLLLQLKTLRNCLLMLGILKLTQVCNWSEIIEQFNSLFAIFSNYYFRTDVISFLPITSVLWFISIMSMTSAATVIALLNIPIHVSNIFQLEQKCVKIMNNSLKRLAVILWDVAAITTAQGFKWCSVVIWIEILKPTLLLT